MTCRFNAAMILTIKVCCLGFLVSSTGGRVVQPFYNDSPAPRSILGSNLVNYKSVEEAATFQEVEEPQERKPRLSLADWSAYNLREPNGRGTYAFGYDNVVDPSGNEQYRNEERLENGTVIGEYGYTDYKNNQIVRVSYTADTRGYRAKTEILPLEELVARREERRELPVYGSN